MSDDDGDLNSVASTTIRKLQWVIRGNFAVPTENPFCSEPPDQMAAPNCQWLGIGLKLLTDYVMGVCEEGVIRHLQPASEKRIERYMAQGGTPTLITLGPHEIVCPGMIDLHIHAPQYSYTGTATDRPLMGTYGWLQTYTFPAESRLTDPDQAQQVYQGVVQQTLRSGTTTAVYFATLHLDPCKRLVDVALERGQRALVGKVCMDRNSPADYCQTLQENLDETEDLIRYIYERAGRRRDKTLATPLPLVLPLVTPRFIPTCTPDLLAALGELAYRHDCHITSHLSESMDEVAYSRLLDSEQDLGDGVGRTDAAIFDAHNLLSDQCIIAHGVHVTDEDMTLLKDRGAAIAHCPLSNFCFAGGSLPCRRLLERDNKVGLGTDVAGGYNPSMLHSSRMAVVASQALDHERLKRKTTENGDAKKEKSPILDYRHAFYLSTLGGARALGLDNRLGTLAVGMEFDAMVLSANVPRSPVRIFPKTDTLPDIFQKLCVLGDDRNVTRVFVQGRDVTVTD